MSQRPKLKPNWSEHWNTVRNSTKLAEAWDEMQKHISASSAWWMFASRSAPELQARGGCSNSPIKPNEGRCPRAAEPWPCNTFSSYLQFFVLKQLNSTNKRQLILSLFMFPMLLHCFEWYQHLQPSLVLQDVGLTEDAVKARPACLLLHHPLNSLWCTMLNA